ncbi:MAG: isochorismatase family protein [Deltaproteobacteria bacterium]|nr:isochorismatase family protein [Deltaproteobacteria bacterium]
MSYLLDPDDALVVLIDVQERHYPTVFDGAATLARMERLLRASRALGAHTLWTEHVPRAFGPTLPALSGALEGLQPITKRTFGCFLTPDFERAVAESGRRTLYLIGAETHICVQQTALQALDRGLGAVLVADALTARGREDHERALARVAAAGGVVTTWEALVYEWMQTSAHPRFKEVLGLVKGR